MAFRDLIFSNINLKDFVNFVNESVCKSLHRTAYFLNFVNEVNIIADLAFSILTFCFGYICSRPLWDFS